MLEMYVEKEYANNYVSGRSDLSNVNYIHNFSSMYYYSDIRG